jgi:large subunit ribosomal protein L28
MAKCMKCGKAVTFGHAISHSKRATNRPFRPNLQKVSVPNAEGRMVQKTFCTKCIKALGKVR